MTEISQYDFIRWAWKSTRAKKIVIVYSTAIFVIMVFFDVPFGWNAIPVILIFQLFFIYGYSIFSHIS